jgi:glycosyltransferase involved in cell wall biosynthesis
MGENSKKVSVVMSVFGYKEYIDDSIKSILEQTLEDFEFIIIDDDCGYDLKGKIKKFDDPRIIYIKNSKNIGLTCSLIKGISRARGKYIARQDAGNVSLENRLGVQYDFMEKNNQYYLIGSSVELIDESGSIICRIIANSNPYYVMKKLPSYNCINHSTIMFKNNGEASYRPKFKYSQDYDFYLNLLSKKYLLGNIPQVLLKERMTPYSITYAQKNQQDYFKNKAQQFYFERLNLGGDSYNSTDLQDLSVDAEMIKNKNSGPEKVSFYQKQKIYYFLFSGRVKKAREQILNALKVKLDFKLFIYLIASFLPFVIRLNNKLKGREYG